MEPRLRYLKYVCLFLLFGLTACTGEDSVFESRTETGELEQIVLKLNVQKESVVQTRAAATVSDEEKVESLDFLVFDENDQLVLHKRPEIEWTGAEYKMTVDVPSYKGNYKLCMIANYPITEGMIPDLSTLLACRSKATTQASVAFPLVMTTDIISLTGFNTVTINNAMTNAGGAFKLWRNVAKFSVNVSAANFELTSVEWRNCPAEATIMRENDYTVSSVYSFSSSVLPISPVYIYHIKDYGTNHPNQPDGFHVVIHGNYTAKDGTITNGYYKIRLNTSDGSGNKVPLTSIDGNSHYKIDIKSVSGKGLSSLQLAEKNGFSNDMEALTYLEYKGTYDYREIYLQNGYQLGMESSHWKIYDSNKLSGHTLGHIYRCIRDASLSDYTILDPDYPNRKRMIMAIRAGTNMEIKITSATEVHDTPNTPVEMELRFTDLQNYSGSKPYTINSVIQYGVLQRPIKIERSPSIKKGYTVLTMPDTYNAEVLGGASSWVGVAEQRHEGTTLYPQIDSENNLIFIHITENKTKASRKAVVHLFGKNGYYEVHILQKG